MPELTDLSVIRTLCEKYDFALSKGFGQNFIINPGLPPKIVDASGVDKNWGVLEIGPGIGVLTKELASRAAKVVSIEVDERLPPLLAETMAGVDNFKLVLQDVLKVDLRALIEEEFPGMPVAVCANLPYYITSPIVMKLLGDRLPIQNLTVMVQKEAADRLAAAPGTRASSAISCAVSYYATSKLMFTAAPGSFYPAPKVTSAVVRMDIRPAPAVQVEDENGYFALIRAAFGQRRKTAANAIASGLGLPKEKVIAAIEAAGFDARIRPEALTLEDFAKIQQALGWGNWQATVASVTGLVAKENIVGTMGILYGGGDATVYQTLASKFTEPSGLSFLLFNLLCAPCFAAMGAIKREMNSAKWFWFAIGYQCGLAYLVSLVVYQIGVLITAGTFGVGTVVAFLIIAFFLYMLFRPNKNAQFAKIKTN